MSDPVDVLAFRQAAALLSLSLSASTVTRLRTHEQLAKARTALEAALAEVDVRLARLAKKTAKAVST
jgi:hypothetical protein